MGARFEIIPDYRFPAAVVQRETLNGQRSISDTQLSVCALGEVLRFGYGLNRVGAYILQPLVDQSYSARLLLPFIVARGPIDDSVPWQLSFGGEALGTSITKQVYYGTTGQAIDPWLAAAWLGRASTVYADTLDGIAWGVLRIPRGYEGNVGDLTIQARMLKVALTDGGTPTYSTNPAYWLADFITNTTYGRGELLDWSTVPAVAAVNDQVVGGSSRRRGGVMIDSRRELDDIENTLRAYAGCWVVREDGYVRLVPDAPAEPVFAFTTANTKLDSIKIAGPKAKDTPTVVTVIGTDTTVIPWKEMSHTEYAPGVQTGTTPWREEIVRMPGIQNKGWLRRESLRRLNEYTVSDLTVNLEAFGDAIQLRRGDVFSLTDSEGFAAKPFRLVGLLPSPSPGMWTVTGKEYDPQVYSDAVAVEPTTPDSSFPVPTAPPTVTGLTLTEDIFITPQGLTVRRIIVEWDDSGYEFLLHYLVQVYENSTSGQRVEAKPTTGTSVATGALQEGHTYAVTVTVVSRAAAGTPAESTLLIGGSVTLPVDVTSLAQSVVGNVTRLSWATPSDNPSAIELRYGLAALGTNTAAFNSATLLNRVAMPSSQYETTAIPTGTWRVFAKFRDALRTTIYPLGRESANPAYVDLTIAGAGAGTPPPSVVIGSDLIPAGVTLVNMTLGNDGCWVTNMGDTWAALFPGVMSTYTNPLASYHTSGTSSLTTDSVDLGASKKATIIWSPTWTDISGTAIAYIETSPDNSAWTTQAAGLVWSGTTRYVRGKIETLTTGTVQICSKGRFQVQVDGVQVAIENAAIARGIILDAFNLSTFL